MTTISAVEYLKQVNDRLHRMELGHAETLGRLQGEINALKTQASASLTQQLDQIPGRRVFYNEVATLAFTAANAGQRLTAMTFLINQDGAFIMTHYPLVMWRPSAPANATQFGRFKPPYTWPLPAQQASGGNDFVNVSWELISAGSGRQLQNAASPPLFSSPNNALPLPVPTVFPPNDVINLVLTLESVFFDPAAVVPTTGGTFECSLPGYRIVNL